MCKIVTYDTQKINQSKAQNISPYGFKLSSRSNQIFVTPKELSKQLQVSQKTLERLRKSGGGPPFVKVRNQIRYPIAELEKWLEQQTATSSNRGERITVDETSNKREG